MKKKFAAAVLIIALSLTLVACGGGDNSNTNNDSSSEQEAEAPSSDPITEVAESAEEEEIIEEETKEEEQQADSTQQTFDAAGYIKALLDNSYKNDSTAFVEMGIGTPEEAAANYEQTLDAEMESLLASMDLTEEQTAGYRDFFAQMLAGVKYTVGEAEEQEDGSFVVTISYEQMNVFVPTMTNYFTKMTELTNEWTASGEVPTEEELNTIVIDYLLESFVTALENVTYDEPAETTIRIELIDNVYTPNEEDVMNLEGVLFDIEEMMDMEIE